MCVPPHLLLNAAPATAHPSAPVTIPVQDPATASTSSAASSLHSFPMAIALAMATTATISTNDPDGPILPPC